MAAVYQIEESGVEVARLALPQDLYYLLDNDGLLRPQSEVGYCEHCSDYTWIEDLSPPGRDEEFADQEMRVWYSAFEQYLKSRTSPPRCLHCGGMRVASIGWAEELINPITGRACAVRVVGTAYIPGLAPLFLSKDGHRLELPPEQTKELAERGRGHWVA